MKRISSRKFLSIISAWSLLINQFLPFASALIVPAYAQEEVIASPSPELNLLPIVSPEPTPLLNPSPFLLIEPSPQTTTSAEVIIPSSSPELSPSLDSQLSADAVVLNQTYKAPQNDQVTVTFTQLPDNPGTLTIKEVKLTAAQQQTIGAFSDTAYDISSDMADGTFQYDLTLPLPDQAKGKNVEVKSSETVAELADSETVDQPKAVTNDTVTITGLNHFTVFVLVNDVDNAGSASTADDIANGVLSTIQDSYIKANAVTSNFGDAVSLIVRSSDNSSPDENWRALVEFNLSSVPLGSTINNAKVRLFMTARPSATVQRDYDIYRITQSWVEGDGGTNNNPAGEVRWDNQPTFTVSATGSTQTPITNNTWVEWDVTSDVQAFINGTATNYGWLIRDRIDSDIADDQATFRSRESGTENQRPQLVVDFTQSDNINGFNSPTAEAVVNTNAGDNNGYSNPGNAFAGGDSLYATDNTSGVNNNSDCSGIGADKHIFYNYNLSIPAGATINGIEVKQDLKVNNLNDSPFTCIQLSWNGGTDWTTVKQFSLTSADPTPYYFGNLTDTWGRIWNYSDFTNTNFMVRVANGDTDNANDSTNFSLDWIPVRVYYTPDTTDPTTPGTPTTPTPTNNQTPTWTWDPSSDTNLDHYFFFWDTILGGEANSSGSLSSVTTSYQILTPLLEGIWYGKVSAFDIAGNFSTSGNGSALVDTTDPVSSATAGGYTYGDWSSSNVTITFGCTDSGSGCETTPVPYSNQYPYHCIDTADTCTPNTPTHDLGISGNGTWYVRYFSRDVAGNSETVQSVQVNIDKTFPSISFDAPADGSLLKSTVLLQASGSDEGGSGLNPLKFSYRKSADSDFTDIGIDSEDPYELSWDTTPLTDGDYVLRVAASDGAGNIFWPSDVNVTIDNTAPETPTANPEAGNYTSDQSVTLTTSETADIFYTLDGLSPDDNSTPYTGVITVDHDMTIKAIAYDKAGNASGILEAVYGIVPVISGETSGSITTGGLTVTWTTDDLATSRVIFDTVSHPGLGAAPNYDYANSTIETDTDPKVTSHTVILTGLGSATTYYYRIVSHGSPEVVGPEHSFVTKALDATATTTGDGGTTDGGTTGEAAAAASPSPGPVLLGFAEGVLGETTRASEEPLDTGRADNNVIPTASPKQVLGLQQSQTPNFIWLILLVIGLIYTSYRLSKRYLHR